jgi:Ca2+/Na+ antiporter
MRLHQAVGSLVSIGVAVISGSVTLLLTYALGKAAFVEPRSLEAVGGRLRHYTDRLEVSADGSLRLIRHPHPVLFIVGVWLASVLVLVASVYMLRRYARPRLVA